MILGAGLHFDVPADVYFADPAPEISLTQSLAKIIIDQSPKHAAMAHPRLVAEVDAREFEYDKARAIGNAAHKLMLGRGKEIAVIKRADFRSGAAKDDRDDALAAGLEPVLLHHFDIARAMVAAAQAQLLHIEGARYCFFSSGHSEVVGVIQTDGIWLRTMIDWISDNKRLVVDYKTGAQSASPHTIGKRMASDLWHLQAATHERVLDTIDPENAGRRRFLYVAQENEPPYALTVNEIGEAALTIGRKMLQYAVDTWRTCMEGNHWPAYPLRIIRPELPAWAENAWMTREVAEYEAEQERIAAPKMLTDLSGG